MKSKFEKMVEAEDSWMNWAEMYSAKYFNKREAFEYLVNNKELKSSFLEERKEG